MVERVRVGGDEGRWGILRAEEGRKDSSGAVSVGRGVADGIRKREAGEKDGGVAR
jgi:hypothetical protein